jgi:electron transfer flavoprotein alpha subunit
MGISKDIWVFLETEKVDLKKVSLETLTLGRRMADQNHSVLGALLTQNQESQIKTAAQYGADRIYLPAGVDVSQPDRESILSWMENLFNANPPEIFLMGVTPLSRELAPRMAARFKFSLITECVDLKLEKGQLTGRRPVLNGKAHAAVSCRPGATQMATLAAAAGEAKKALPERFPEVSATARCRERPSRVEFLEYLKGDPAAISLNEAEVIIAVGKGLQDVRNLKLIEELAGLLGASLGGTRVAVDLKYIPPERQIGMTGQTVAPHLLISCGISGQYPHTVGMDSSETIIVINQDKGAPMFKLATLGLVGNLEEIVPAISNRIKSQLNLRREGSL